ncbi:MAG: endonuclease III [Melioribacteraceae bacterium]|nr:endonuclease III [Melioribacteraceae bacterium]
MTEKKKFISEVNKLLIKQFGVPGRQKPLPKPLDTLIATILSQNTNDNNSYRAYINLKSKFPEWEEVQKVNRITIEKLIRAGGLAKQKSHAIKNLISELYKRNDFKLDFILNLDNKSAINELTSFDGIGVKTASCVLLFSLDRNICPVDTHVHRTANRIGIVSEKTPDKTFYALNKTMPEGMAHSFHTNLIRLGRDICKPTKPYCSICPLIKICKYPDKNSFLVLYSKKKSFMLLDNV